MQAQWHGTCGVPPTSSSGPAPPSSPTPAVVKRHRLWLRQTRICPLSLPPLLSACEPAAISGVSACSPRRSARLSDIGSGECGYHGAAPMAPLWLPVSGECRSDGTAPAASPPSLRRQQSSLGATEFAEEEVWRPLWPASPSLLRSHLLSITFPSGKPPPVLPVHADEEEEEGRGAEYSRPRSSVRVAF